MVCAKPSSHTLPPCHLFAHLLTAAPRQPQERARRKDVHLLCSKQLNVFEYAVGDTADKSTFSTFFLINVNPLLLSIRAPYKRYVNRNNLLLTQLRRSA